MTTTVLLFPRRCHRGGATGKYAFAADKCDNIYVASGEMIISNEAYMADKTADDTTSDQSAPLKFEEADKISTNAETCI